MQLSLFPENEQDPKSKKAVRELARAREALEKYQGWFEDSDKAEAAEVLEVMSENRDRIDAAQKFANQHKYRDALKLLDKCIW